MSQFKVSASSTAMVVVWAFARLSGCLVVRCPNKYGPPQVRQIASFGSNFKRLETVHLTAALVIRHTSDHSIVHFNE